MKIPDKLAKYKEVLLTLDEPENFYTVFEKVLSSIPGIKYNKAFKRESAQEEINEAMSYITVLKDSIFGVYRDIELLFEISLQVEPLIFIGSDHTYFFYSADITIKDYYGSKLIRDIYDITHKFSLAETQESVESFVKSKYRKLLHEAGDSLYKTLKLFLPKNEVAQ